MSSPLRQTGLRTAEGVIVLRDTGATFGAGVEGALYELFLSAPDLRSANTDLKRLAHGRAQAFEVDAARANIVRSLNIPRDARVLEIGARCGALTRYLGERAALVDAVEPSPRRARAARARTRDLPGVEVFVGEHSDVPDGPTYDVIVAVGVFEHVGDGSADQAPYVDFLRKLGRCLRPGGTLALAIDNKVGAKYLVGASDDDPGKVFDSSEGYPSTSDSRTFSRRELEAMFVAAGLLPSVRIAFPDYKLSRVIMDADSLERRAPQLLRNLPDFASAELRSPGPRLADEARVWHSLVAAGLAPDTGNSFLVLAGKGAPQDLWPADLAAVYYSRSRREAYSIEKRVTCVDDQLVVDRVRVGLSDPAASVALVDGRELVVPGPTVPEAAVALSIAEIGALLSQWRDELVQRTQGADEMPVDFVPNSLILRSDGSMEAIGREWTARGWSVDRVVRRGTLWFAARLVRSTVPSRWAGTATVRDVAVQFGEFVGLDADGAWIAHAISEEAELIAEVSEAGTSDQSADAIDRIVEDLTSMMDEDLAGLSPGDRLPEVFRGAQGYLTASENGVISGAGVVEDLRESLRESDGLRKQEKELAVARERAAESTVRSAEVLQRIFADRLTAAEVRYANEHSRADRADEALAALRGSRAFRLIGMYYRGIERVAPTGSRRRGVYSASIRAGAHLARRVRPLPVEPRIAIVLPTAELPLVSIVVPVHGKWSYTEQCLRAIAETTGAIEYEVIVVDDASPDDTLERLQAVGGVRIVHLDDNVGFVGACNAGIEAARGEYVVLLNNDTRVHPGWLTPLVETVAEPGVGLVGSRLVYPDGRLQEAGGIVFSDGSGWNYGKFEEPENPAYTYRRDVDYCSGASIIVRKSVLDDLGNLDTRFAPAYYDDTDLAFGVRELGLRVVYEPRSVVVHDEGISNGTDESSGVKAYQVVNKAKFVEKWRTRLTEQCEPSAMNVPFAARRRNGERIIVVIDHYVPRPDEDSGSVRMMGILRTLRDLGYGVLFVPDNRVRTEHWTEVLAGLGIEVFYGHGDLSSLLRGLAGHIDAVMISRVTVAWHHVFNIQSVLPDVPVIFDTVDLHFLREQRAAELVGTKSVSSRARTLKALELAIATSADTTIVVSTFEQALLRELLPQSDVKVLPNVHQPELFASTTEERRGLLFVGSFAHQPNADGLRWFFDQVLPLIETRLPGMPVSVVGRDPDPELVASAPPNVTFFGWVEDLAPLYDGARVAIAPLRYGAGVKGKIGESMAHGVPVVMTPVGAEGMSIEHQRTAWVASDAEAFAEGVVALCSDDDMWMQISKQAAEHIDLIFGPQRFAERLRAILP